MGSESWSKWVPWKKSLTLTLEEAQKEELEEQGYDSLEAAQEETGEDGTASVLDISGFSEEPEPGMCWKLADDEVAEHFASARPSHAQIEERVDAMAEDLGRGESLCVIAYEKGQPTEVYFAGWSLD